MLVLGLNLFHADSSAAIIEDGEVVFAVAEERLNRVKHYGGIPKLAIRACLDHPGADIRDIDHLAVGRDKDSDLSKKVQYALANPTMAEDGTIKLSLTTAKRWSRYLASRASRMTL